MDRTQYGRRAATDAYRPFDLVCKSRPLPGYALLADLQTSIPRGPSASQSPPPPAHQAYFPPQQQQSSPQQSPYSQPNSSHRSPQLYSPPEQQHERSYSPHNDPNEPHFTNGAVDSRGGYPSNKVYYQESKEEVRTETRSSGPHPTAAPQGNELDSLLSELNSTRYSAAKGNSERANGGPLTGAGARPSVDSLLNELNSVSSSQQQSSRLVQHQQQSMAPQPVTASTATRDLDDLMAELSDFKVKEVMVHPAPPPPLPASKLLYNSYKTTTTTTTSNDTTLNNVKNNVSTTIIDVHNASVKPTQNDQLRSPALVRKLLNRNDTYAKPEKPKSPSPPAPAPPPPPKEPSPPLVNELDCMLGSLANHMTEQGVTTTQKGCCCTCDKPIVGQVITALGKTWHPEHFTCSHCSSELGSKNFFERDGRPYCEACYHELFSPRCAYCDGSILDKCVTALDKNWHPDHFFCAQCGNTFGEEGFHEKDGKAYCREDYYNMFAPKCGGCNSPIMENYISALNAQWHPECFVCRDCKQAVTGKSYYAMEGKPVCAACIGVSDDDDEGAEEEDE